MMKLFSNIKNVLSDLTAITWKEFKTIFTDSGVLLILIIAGFGYPLLYSTVYLNESVDEIPVGIIDECGTSYSRGFASKIDATREVTLESCINMDDAIGKMKKREIHGFIVIPKDFSKNIQTGKQTTVSLYINMATFFIYKNIAMACNYVMLDENKNISLQRLSADGLTEQEALQSAEPLRNKMNILFNEGNGFASFFVPGVLVLIIHQLLFLGIGMVSGTRREENANHKLSDNVAPHEKKVHRYILGQAAAYLIIYSIVSAYILILVPRMFGLPHYASAWDIYRLVFPFLLAVIFFSQTWSVFIRNRETGMVMFLFFSVILLFLSGLTWPLSSFPAFWKYFSYIFPATFGVEGYIKINCMGADFSVINTEFVALWIQAIIYFVTACFSYRYINK
ncbi:MAG: ABC transporter permease [Bacteroidales bacterium]|jgi:ABC-2 type transport system permease protein|nr:ABC transporter permease [Bacteroidales bacterium]